LIRVAIFEDNNHLRETLELLLNSAEGFTCSGAYADCGHLEPMLEVNPCDVVLMDIEMPGINGIEATRIIRKKFPGVQVLIQTAFFDDDYIFNAICAGASGYILKNTTPQGYLQAIRDVHAGGSPMTAEIARKVLELFKTNLQPANAAKDYNLTNQEMKVLQVLAAGKSYKLIAAELFISIDTVKSHISNIYAKLHVHSATEAVSKAIRDKII
jgi:DNA-binding NarL/FixJ family response regulator